MSQVHIVTDSASQIPDALRLELDIHVVQIPYEWDGETYIDEVDMGLREFYDRLRQSRTLPKTSGPTPGSYLTVFEKLASDGGSILVVHVGHEFSSTYKTAQIAREMLPSADIHLFDSHSNALGLGFQVLAVARAARQGSGLDELLEVARQARERTGVVFVLEDMRYMQRGGRITFGQRVLASALNLTPILEINQGPIDMIGRVRSSNRAMMKLVEIVDTRLDGRKPVRIGVHHTDNERDAFQLRKLVQEKLRPDEIILREVTPSLGIHIGPGSIGLSYCGGL
jgi:DegV family protein with EDD domain